MYYIQAKARSNSKKYSKDVSKFVAPIQVKDYIINNSLSIVEKPYIFTHIPLSDGTIIIQTVELKDGEIPVSPEKLYQFLTA